MENPIKCVNFYRELSRFSFYFNQIVSEFDEWLLLYRSNFWVHSVIIKLLPCVVLTVISFVLIQVLCQANKRKMKLKGYSNTNSSTNGHRWAIQGNFESQSCINYNFFFIYLKNEIASICVNQIYLFNKQIIKNW